MANINSSKSSHDNAAGYGDFLPEQLLRLMFEKSDDGICIIKHSEPGVFTIAYCNDRYIEMSGFSRGELMAVENILELRTVVEQEPAGDPEFTQLLFSGEACRGVVTWNRPDGKENYLNWSAFGIASKGDRYIVGIDRDVTESRKAQEAVIRKEKWLQLVLERSFDGISVSQYHPDRGTHTLFMCNDRYVEMSGYSRNKLEACPDLNVLKVDIEAQEGFKEHLRSDGVCRGVSSWKRPDGKENYYEWTVSEIKIDGNHYLVGADRDITERRRAEQALAYRENLLRRIFDSSPDAMNIVKFYPNANKHELLMYNERFVEMSGRTVEELESMEDSSVFRTVIEQEPRGGNSFSKRMRQGGVARGISSWSRPDGKENYYEWTSVGLLEGDDVLVLGFDHDITERLRNERAVRDSEQRYRDLFDESPVPLWEMDGSGAKQYLDELVASGVEDLALYFKEHPHETKECFYRIKILDVNQATLEMYGATDKEFFLTQLRDVLPQSAFDQLGRHLSALYEKRSVVEISGFSHIFSGQRLEVIYRWRTTSGSEDTWSRVLVSIIDVTERNLAERALRESEQRYRTLFENSPIALSEIDYSQVKITVDELLASGVKDLRAYLNAHPDLIEQLQQDVRIVGLNQAYLELFGVESLQQFVEEGSKDLESVQAIFVDSLASMTQGVLHGEDEMRDTMATGEPLNLVIHWSLTPNHAETWSSILTSSVNITELRQAEEAILQERQRYHELFENSPISLWVSDYSEVKDILDELSAQGVKDYRTYLVDHPEIVAQCADAVRIVDVNQATLDLYEAKDMRELLDSGEQNHEVVADAFREQLCSLLENKVINEDETRDWTVTGKPIDIAVRWSMAPGAEHNWSRVLSSIRNITERKRAQAILRDVHSRLMDAREQERQHLSRELHDSIGQQLVALNLSLRHVLGGVEESIDPASAKSLSDLAGHVNGLIREVRTICHGIYPPTLESLGLVPALRQLATETEMETVIEVRCEHDIETTRLSPRAEIELFRIVQEALTNALKHSNGGHVRIELECQDGSLMLAVTDDGQGFDPTSAIGGMGLNTMKERAESIGGTLKISSRPGRTQIAVKAPRQSLVADPPGE